MTEQTPGLLGSTARIPESGKYIQSQDVGLVTCDEEMIDKNFCYYLLPSEIVKKQLAAGAQQTKIRHTSPDKIEACTVFIPKPNEQRKIGKLLSTLDKLIDLKRKENALLESMARQIYDYWFVQFDFPNEDGKPYKSSDGKMEWNEKLKREIPEGWSVSTYGQEFKVKLGGTPSTAVGEYWDGDINWLSSGEVQDFPVSKSIRKITNDAICNSSTELLHKNSILISITRYLRVTILNIDACINQSVVGFEETKNLKKSYTYFSLSAEVPRLMNLRSGAQQPHISKEIVESSPILIPDDKILGKYYACCEPLIINILNVSVEINELQSLRDYLLPLLMNGQVTIKD